MSAQVFTISGTTPAAPGTAVVGTAIQFDRDVETLDIIASLVGATGGVLDLYLQTSEDDTTYTDFLHFAQLGAGAAATIRRIILNRGQPASAITAVGQGTTPALAANTVLSGISGKYVRLLAVAGASTTAGGAQSIKLHARYSVP